MASAWRGGIGKYPQNPERLRQYLRPPEAKPTEEEVLPQPRRMRRVFFNTSEPCLGHDIVIGKKINRYTERKYMKGNKFYCIQI